MLRREEFREALYQNCSDDDVAHANPLLAPEPSEPGNTPARTTDQNFGRVPRVYIELTQDRAVSYFSNRDELTEKILLAGVDR
jgi:hypothetical protein